MRSISQILADASDWTAPRVVEGNPFRLASRLAPPSTAEEIAAAWPRASLPRGLVDLWLSCREAELFVDVDYGQWGLKLHSPGTSATTSRRARTERPSEFRPGDAVVGEFLGDQDVLVVDKHGGVLVALPLDSRADWYRPAATLADFLTLYIAKQGDKFWEQRT